MVPSIERYTPNEVGPAPEDWQTPLLSEVSTLITNGFVGTASPYYVEKNEGVPYFFGKNVRANKLDPRDIRYITPEFHKMQAKTALKTGDLLTVQSGHIGETAVVTEEYDDTNCHALIVTRLKPHLVNSVFLSYYINSEIGKARLKGLEVGSTILHINTKDLKKFRIILPPLPEQQKIAKILTTWDKAINTTERLIENSKQQKKALMQQLLTGQKRLLDDSGQRFSGDWKEVKLEDISEVKGGKRLPKGNSLSESKTPYPYIRVADMYMGGVDISDIKYVPDHVAPLIKNYTISKDDLFITVAGTLGIVGEIPDILDGANLTENADKITNIKCDKTYLLYVMTSNIIQRYIQAESTQNAQPKLALKRVREFKIPLPSIKEQQKIATVLTNADREIEVLEQQLADLQQEKKALMQQLLTGKKRVLVD